MKEQELASQIADLLALCSMQVKGFAISGEDPQTELSAEGETVGVLRYVWEPEMQFKDAKLFTKRNFLSLSLWQFDPLGLYSPVYSRITHLPHYIEAPEKIFYRLKPILDQLKLYRKWYSTS